MGASKTYQYKPSINIAARTSKALGHSARMTIMRHLRRYGTVTNAEIMLLTSLSDGTVNQHLKELTHAGLIRAVYHDFPCYVLTEEAPAMIAAIRRVSLLE